MSFYVIFMLLTITATIIGLWKIFMKAGFEGWKVIVPFYNFYIWLKIIKKPIWWFIFLIIPFINVFVILLMIVELAKCFKKYGLGAQAMAAVFPFIYLPYLAFSPKETYLDPAKRPVIKKGFVREWVDAILFAVIAATIIRTFLIEAYTIPTSSMEKSLLIGDFLFVSKISYGPRVPNTPLSFPFAHHTLPLTSSTPSFLDWIQLPYYRFSGFATIKNGDVVVFNYPDGDTTTVELQSNRSYYEMVREMGRAKVWKDYHVIARPVDKRENFIKRCIAIHGDKLEIADQAIYLNGKEFPMPDDAEYYYTVKTKGNFINKKYFSKFDITEGYKSTDKFGNPVSEDPYNFLYNFADSSYLLVLTKNAAEKLKVISGVVSVTKMIHQKGTYDARLFPFDSTYKWNVDNYGPITVPGAGQTMEINSGNISFYRRIIDVYEENDLLEKDGKIYINGKEASSYTFKMNYYWLMGDNRHNSADSRFWGFVPEDHIVGKAVFVWLSLDPNKGLFSGKIRWNKMFRFII
ncbi:MAG: signal peptidase I [Bacteroidota bacterium]